MIKTVVINDELSWQDKVFLEFDVDWAADFVILDTLKILREYNVQSTWFSTHRSPVLEELKTDADVELGIHPNFVPLLNGDTVFGRNAKEVVERILEIYPDAKSAKAHSLVDGSRILDIYANCGITHDNTFFIDNPIMDYLAPWQLWNGIIRVPLLWEDDYSIVSYYQRSVEDLLQNQKGLKVFGFHPIHIFLNTECLSRYEKSRPYFRDPNELSNFRYEGYGVRNKFIEILKYMSESK